MRINLRLGMSGICPYVDVRAAFDYGSPLGGVMLPARRQLGLLLLLVACAGEDGKRPPHVDDSGERDTIGDTHTGGTDTTVDTDTVPPVTDADADGYVTEAAGGDDCDDADASVHPWAEETCEDGLDSDCDGIDGRCGAWPSGDMAYVADAAFWGENAADRAGGKVLLADMNGDGLDDALISAAFHDRYARDGSTLYVAFAPFTEGGMPLSMAETRVDGVERDEKLFEFATGDADGDGVRDLLLGSVVSEQALLLPGPVTGELTPEAAAWRLDRDELDDVYLAFALDVADLDGDGVGSLVIAAPRAQDENGFPQGKVSVVPGTTRGLTDYEDVDDITVATLEGSWVAIDEAAYVGWSLHHADVDGDGLDDLIVGGTDTAGLGALYLVLSPFEGHRTVEDVDGALVAEGEPAFYPFAVATGDLDGDGALDLVVGAREDSTNADLAGAVHVVSGYGEGDSELRRAGTRLLGIGKYETVGTSVALGDFDGDAQIDLAVGAGQARRSADADPESVVRVVYELPTGSSELLAVAGTSWTAPDTDYLGASIAVGDASGDGRCDLLIGAHMFWGKSTEPGATYLMSGL